MQPTQTYCHSLHHQRATALTIRTALQRPRLKFATFRFQTWRRSSDSFLGEKTSLCRPETRSDHKKPFVIIPRSTRPTSLVTAALASTAHHCSRTCRRNCATCPRRIASTTASLLAGARDADPSIPAAPTGLIELALSEPLAVLPAFLVSSTCCLYPPRDDTPAATEALVSLRSAGSAVHHALPPTDAWISRNSSSSSIR